MLVLRTPKGWTGPKEVDGLPVEGCWRAHQVPISLGADTDRHLAELEEWLRSYKPEELFNADGTPVEPVAAFPPAGKRRMGANPHTNGGLLLRDLRTRDHKTLREVSEKAGVSLGYLSEVERGQKEASSELLSSIAQSLGLSTAQMLRMVADYLDSVAA